jgi:lipoprotein NlpD
VRRTADSQGPRRLGLVVLLVAAVVGCSSTRWDATVEGRAGEAAGRPISGATYRVQHGDTLNVIATRASLDPRAIVAWNQLASPDRIYVGQVLRLTPPPDQGARAPARLAEGAAGRGPERTPVAAVAREPADRARSAAVAAAEGLRWQWPTSGRVVERFSAGDAVRKGVKIAGKPGQAIVAAEAGEVVYSGSGLVGYGPLIIIQHKKNYLSAYGHNRKLLVRQGDQVTKGTQIAEMGLAGGAPLLHFEIRRDGDPVDPLALLPRR